MQIVVAIVPAIRKGGEIKSKRDETRKMHIPRRLCRTKWMVLDGSRIKSRCRGKSGIFAPVDLLYDQLFPVRLAERTRCENCWAIKIYMIECLEMHKKGEFYSSFFSFFSELIK